LLIESRWPFPNLSRTDISAQRAPVCADYVRPAWQEQGQDERNDRLSLGHSSTVKARPFVAHFSLAAGYDRVTILSSKHR
jgi:hypothetical protein